MIADAYLDGVHIHDLSVTGRCALSRFGGLGTPPPRENRPNRPRRHGAIELTTYYQPRVFDIAGYVREVSNSAAWDKFDDLGEAMALNGLTHTLRFKRLGKTYFERCDVSVAAGLEPALRPAGETIPWSVVLVAADPRIYLDTVANLTFAGAGTAVNTGNFSTAPVITFHGGGANPGVRNDALAAENLIKLNYTLLAGDTAVVDVKQRSVKLNGNDRPDILDVAASDFWSLVSGDNPLVKVGGATSIDVSWRSARIT